MGFLLHSLVDSQLSVRRHALHWHKGENRDSAVLSACFPPMWPGFDSWTCRHMWVEFVVGSPPCS